MIFMAVLKIKSSTGNIKDVRAYLEKEERHVERTCYHIDSEEHWDSDMVTTKMLQGKTDGRQYVWIVQSFEDEKDKKNYNEKTIHEMGQELAEVFAEKGFQSVVITHNDTDNLHNHIIINTVNAEDGRKLQLSNAKTAEKAPKSDFLYRDIYKLNDEICMRYGLNTLTESKAKKTQRERLEGKQPTSYKTDEQYIKSSYKEDMRNSLQSIFSSKDIKTKEDFEKALEDKGLKITRITGTGNITYQDKDGNKVRAKNLGDFNSEDVSKLIERNNILEDELDKKVKVARISTGRGGNMIR